MMLLHGACIEYRESEPPPTQTAFEDLKTLIVKEQEEAIRFQQNNMRNLKADKGRRGSFKVHHLPRDLPHRP